MSLASQTSQPAPAAFDRPILVRFAVVGALVLAATFPIRGQIARALAAADPHLPDLSLFAGLPLAVKLHIFGALAALVLGGVLMFARKGRTFHRTAGWVWVGLVSLVAGSSLFIMGLNHGRWSLLHLLTAWTLIILPIAVMAARRHRISSHRRTMMGLFYGGFAINLLIAAMPGRTLWMMFLG